MDAFVFPLTFPSGRATTMQAAGTAVIVSTARAVFESDAYQKNFNAPDNVPIVINWADMGYEEGKGIGGTELLLRLVMAVLVLMKAPWHWSGRGGRARV